MIAAAALQVDCVTIGFVFPPTRRVVPASLKLWCDAPTGTNNESFVVFSQTLNTAARRYTEVSTSGC